MAKKVTTIGVLTSGGDAPGMNLCDSCSSQSRYFQWSESKRVSVVDMQDF